MLLAQVYLLSFLVFDWDSVSLIAAGPDHNVRFAYVLGLSFRVRRTDQSDPLFRTRSYVLVKNFGVTTQARIRIHVLSFEGMLVEVSVAIGQCFLRRWVEDANLVPIDNCNIVSFKMGRQVAIWLEAPVIIVKVTKALAGAQTLYKLLLVPVALFLGFTRAALFTIGIWPWLRVRQPVVRRSFTKSIVLIVGGGTIEHEPRHGKTRV